MRRLDCIFFLVFSPKRFFPPYSSRLKHIVYPIFVRFSNWPVSPVFPPPSAVKARNPLCLDEGIVVESPFRGARSELRIDPLAENLVTHDLQCASTISGKGSAKDLKLLLSVNAAPRWRDVQSYLGNLWGAPGRGSGFTGWNSSVIALRSARVRRRARE